MAHTAHDRRHSDFADSADHRLSEPPRFLLKAAKVAMVRRFVEQLHRYTPTAVRRKFYATGKVRPAGMRHQLRRCAGLANDATSCQSQQFVMLAI
jgi:proline dehydrogenase